MYTPSKFKQQELQELRQFVVQNPFAILVAASSNGGDASYLPLIWAEEDGAEFGCLYGPFAKGNRFWKNAHPEQSWLIIFQNAGHYISANFSRFSSK
ncbi:FMN-binding negative transcriptional regulator [Avibacterium paragallinarum]|uniref:Protease synthase and sporulation protein PAI 2 n=1 Tax=Avibacterium paragallinarum TaxID=728 RepID=A0A377I7E5_AVIPA|nr:FMN-binding negative transcriptional regulator [Avibacterium paragallinarum]POY47536.1 hypothetical protein C3364_01420 [Avibacterium paragallinarum]RZN75307.1 hypothetical protein EC523_08800 [Avibacterium paragallinarum]CDF99381.1 Hypothetical FMN-binding negative transcriptional regulator [Avibacterium paragallinarum JF4211]STO71214.1 Protease synthase and sporulation protein PAI 2 [Avibacterium paragallinarum]